MKNNRIRDAFFNALILAVLAGAMHLAITCLFYNIKHPELTQMQVLFWYFGG